MINKIVLSLAIAALSISSPVISATFALNNNQSQPDSESVETSVDWVIATGYGITKQSALKNAYQDAIRQYIGVVVDSEQILSNNNLIKDEILTASNGYVKQYEELNVMEDEGLFVVEIKALVKSQAVQQKMASLNIATRNVSFDKNKVAEIQSKAKSAEEISEIIEKQFLDITNKQVGSELIKVNIENANFNEDEAVNNQIPLDVTYSFSFNLDYYNSLVKNLTRTFENLGLKKYNSITFSEFKVDSRNKRRGLQFTSTKKMRDLSYLRDKNHFFIMEPFAQGYKIDVWEIPMTINLSNIVDRGNYLRFGIKDDFTILLELLTEQSTLQIEELHPRISATSSIGRGYGLFTIAPSSNGMSFMPYWRFDRKKGVDSGNVIGLAPLFTDDRNTTERYTFNHTTLVKTDELSKITNLKISLNEN